MSFFNSAKIDSNQLRVCLHYFEKACQIETFHAKEVDLYNEALVKYGNSVMDDSTAIPLESHFCMIIEYTYY